MKTGRKLYQPAVQRWGAEQTGRKLYQPAVQRWGAEQTHAGLWSPLDERWGSGQQLLHDAVQLRRAQAAAGDVVLLYGDESEALTHPYLAHAWAECGADLRVQAPRRNAQRLRPGQARKVARLGVLDAITRLALVHTSPTKRSSDFIALLERLDRAYGPVPGQTRKPVVLVFDNGPIHTSKATTKALAARPWITVDWLLRYAPELNLIEATWRDLKRHHLAHRTFRDTDDLGQAIHQAVAALNKECIGLHMCHSLSKAALPDLVVAVVIAGLFLHSSRAHPARRLRRLRGFKDGR